MVIVVVYSVLRRNELWSVGGCPGCVVCTHWLSVAIHCCNCLRFEVVTAPFITRRSVVMVCYLRLHMYIVSFDVLLSMVSVSALIFYVQPSMYAYVYVSVCMCVCMYPCTYME